MTVLQLHQERARILRRVLLKIWYTQTLELLNLPDKNTSEAQKLRDSIASVNYYLQQDNTRFTEAMDQERKEQEASQETGLIEEQRGV